MSQNNSNFSSNFSSSFNSESFSSFSVSTNVNGKVDGARRSEHRTSNPSGTTVETSSQRLGEDPVERVRHYDNHGREVLEGPESNANRRIEDVTEEKEVKNERA